MAKNDNTAIRVRNLHKTFRIPIEGAETLKKRFINFIKRKKGYREFSPLNGISFDVQKGEFFGIVGRNGSGKSTLLKTISKIYTPEEGSVTVNGTLVPFIELGVGFNPELTGRENVYLNGALLGFSRAEILEMYDEIVEFAELREFMDEKLKNYSSGMQVRLAFSIAIRAKGDILLLDEVLAVGDAAFQQKCYDYFASLRESKRTVVLVTHSMSVVQRFCSRAMLLNEGKIEEIGDIESVVKKYNQLNQAPASKTKETTRLKGDYMEYSVTVRDGDGSAKHTYKPEDRIVIEAEISPLQDLENTFVGITIQRSDGEYVFWKTTEGEEINLSKGSIARVSLDMQNIFGDNSYRINLIVRSNDRSIIYLESESVAKFKVSGWGRNGWMLHPDTHMTIQNTKRGDS